MSLMVHLLTVGRSLKPVKDKPSPFKMKQPILLPKFGSKTTADSSASSPNGQIDESQPSEGQTVVDSTRPGLVGDWPRLLRAIRGKGGPMIQAELSLEAVRVMRNDLQEIGARQGVAGSNPFRSNQTVTVAGHWWTRLNERLFARRRKQS